MERPHLIGAIVRSKHVNVFELSSILSERSAAFVKQMSRESFRTRCETRNSTHVLFQVIPLVTCGTGLRWTSRIQSTARKIGASLFSRSRAFFNNGRWFGWNSGIGFQDRKTCQFVAFSWLQKHIGELPWTHRTGARSQKQLS